MLSKVVFRKRWAAFAVISLISGCTAISDCKYEVGQKIRTKQAWHEYDGCHEQCFTLDYRSGWKAGYYDVVTGGDGCPPLIAPKKYWKPPVFFEHDPGRRHDWYCGYQDGAACAKCQPDHHYLEIFAPPAYCPVETVSFAEVPPSVPQSFSVAVPMPEQSGELQQSEVVSVTEAPVADGMPSAGGVASETIDSGAASDETAASEIPQTNVPKQLAPKAPSEKTGVLPEPQGLETPAVDKAEKYEADPEQSSSQDTVTPDRFPIELVVGGRKFEEKLANANVLRRIVEQHTTDSVESKSSDFPISIVAQ